MSNTTANFSCTLCENLSHKFLYHSQDTDSNDTFSIFQCEQCTLECTYPIPDNLSDYYHLQYHWNRHGFTETLCTRRRMKRVTNLVKNKGKVLDAGCGEGTFLLALKKAGWGVFGTELNATIPATRGLKVGDSLDSMKNLGPFDCITFWHSLEHMHSPKNILLQTYMLLAPQAYVFIAVPNAGGWQSRLFGRKWLHRDVPRHLYHFNQSSLTQLLDETGFDIVKIWHHEFEYDVIGWSQSLLNYLSATQNIFLN